MDDLFSKLSAGPATLQSATLTRADIDRLTGGFPAHLIECDLEEADLSGLDLSHWRFERCNLRHADFSSARLEKSVWQSCRGAFANFGASDLGDARFTSSDFNNSNFRGAALSSASFTSCKLTGSDLSEIRGMDLAFRETLLINVKLPGHSFFKLRLEKVDFSQADLRKCDFRSTIFEDCSLRDANVTGSRFDGADLRGADLGGLRLVDANQFRGATISREQAGQLLRELGLNVR